MKNRPLKAKYNMRLRTDIQDFLPVIGGATPAKQIVSFNAENLATGIISYSGDGALTADRVFAYHDTSCLKIDLIDGDTGTITINGNWDLKSLSVTDQDYARVYRTGKSANAKDRLYFILNEMLRNKVSAGYLYVVPKFYSGTQTATSRGGDVDYDLIMGSAVQKEAAWQKHQTDLTATRYEYANGFDESSWEHITKIELRLQASFSGSETTTYYLQDCSLALPAYHPYTLGHKVTDAYYPDVHEAYNAGGHVDANAIFVSQLFGNDTNLGTDRTCPVKTIEHANAIALFTGLEFYVCIMDSATYKPVFNNKAGINDEINFPITIIADYLETPVIDARAGLENENLGARSLLRTNFWSVESGGTKFTVKKDGTGDYTSIGAAFAALTGVVDCIEIQDSGTYDEYLDIDTAVTIQAGETCLPVWSHAADDLIVKVSASGVIIQGIKFLGALQTTVKAVELVEAAIIRDCTFTGFNNASIILDGFVGNTLIESCLFVDNGETINAYEIKDAVCGGNKTFKNCRGLMLGATTDNIFVYVGVTKVGETLNVFGLSNQILSAYSNSIGQFIYMPATHTTAFTNIYAYQNDTNICSHFTDANGTGAITASYNYIHDNSSINYGIGTAGMSTNINANYFKGVSCGVYCHTNSAQAVCGNIFYRCDIGIHTVVFAGGGSCPDLYNIFVDCDIAYRTGASWTVLSNLVMSGCTVGVELITALALTLNSCIRFNSPNLATAGTITDGTGIIETSPNFKNPYDNDFSFDGLSSMEENPAISIDGLSSFVNPSTAALTFQYMTLIGPVAAKMISTDTVHVVLNQNILTGALIGLNETVHTITSTGLLLSDNGTGARLKLGSVHTNLIAVNNNVGALIKGPVSFVNVTCTENAWGASTTHFGFYAQKNCIAPTFLNCAFVKNTSYDYALNVEPTNCVFYKTYYSVTASKYNNQLLDPVYYYPATRRTGYDADNAAYRASTVLDENIGARNINNVESNLEGQEYEFAYWGTIASLTISEPDYDINFRAVENPQNIDQSIVPIAGQSVSRLDGNYFSRPTAYPRELSLKWGEPGKSSKLVGGKLAIEDIFKSYWVIGLSFDRGVNWAWFKVKKDSALSMGQASFNYSWQPWGNTELTLVLVENFNIVDYVGC
jgi:hypothetical protein